MSRYPIDAGGVGNGGSRTHVFLRCMHPTLENARKEIWERPDENGRKGQRPKSVDQLLGKSKWDMPLCDWIYYLFIYFISFNVREP
jgi:hypothetical protein